MIESNQIQMRGYPYQQPPVPQSTSYPQPYAYPSPIPTPVPSSSQFTPYQPPQLRPQAAPANNSQVNQTNITDLSQDLQSLKQQLRKLTQKRPISPLKTHQHASSSNPPPDDYAARRHFSAEKLPDRRQISLEPTRPQPPFIDTNLPASFAANYQSTTPNYQPALVQYQRPPSSQHIPSPSSEDSTNRSRIEPGKATESKLLSNTYQFREFKQWSTPQGPRIAPFNNPNKRQNQLMVRPKTNSNHQHEHKPVSVPMPSTNSQISHLQFEKVRQERDDTRDQLQAEKKINGQLLDKLNKQRKQSSPNKRMQELAETMKSEQERSNAIILKLRSEIATMTEKKNESGLDSFDEALKGQFQELAQLRKRVEQEQEKTTAAKQRQQVALREVDKLKSELTTQEMRKSTELRSMEQRSSIQLNDVENDYLTAKRTIEMLQGRNRALVKEIKEKDEFIMNFLVGRAGAGEQLEVRSALQKHKLTFPEERSVDELLGEQRELQRLRGEGASR